VERTIEILHERDGVIIARCIEWQRNARQSTHATNGRCIRAVFARNERAPHRLRWIYAHETWLPEAEIQAASYDF
jgi:hypothetical protein